MGTKPEATADARTIALRLLSEGYVTPSEIATALGVDRRNVDYWISAAGLDWRAARASRIARRLARARRSRVTPPIQ